MRSPVIAFGLFAAAAVSPTLVSAAPAGTPSPAALSTVPVVGGAVSGGKSLPVHAPVHAPIRRNEVDEVVGSPSLDGKEHKKHKKHTKRAFDNGTAGGNAYSGGSSDSSGGNVVNNGGDGDDDVIMNDTASESLVLYGVLPTHFVE